MGEIADDIIDQIMDHGFTSPFRKPKSFQKGSGRYHWRTATGEVIPMEFMSTEHIMNAMKITLWNKHHGEPPKDKGKPFYIGRGSPLGNPFTHLSTSMPGTVRVASREEAVDRYRTWLEERYQAGDRKIMGELHRIFEAAEDGPVQLVCFCAPHKCHGEVIRQLMLDNATEKES